MRIVFLPASIDQEVLGPGRDGGHEAKAEQQTKTGIAHSLPRNKHDDTPQGILPESSCARKARKSSAARLPSVAHQWRNPPRP